MLLSQQLVIDPHSKVVAMFRTSACSLSALLSLILCLCLLGCASPTNTAPTLTAESLTTYKPGDYLVRQKAGRWSAVKILVIDRGPAGAVTFHCLFFNPTTSEPSLDSLERTGVQIQHAPMDALAFGDDWQRVGNRPVQKSELVGFEAYLKETDFPRYIRHTGRDAEKVISAANAHYARANDLGNRGKREQAIAEYGKAIELVPFFYEALDNRGLTYMELGDLRAAIADFEESLRVNPDGVTAYFSRAECMMKRGALADAENQFRQGATRFPEHKAMFLAFLEKVEGLKKK